MNEKIELEWIHRNLRHEKVIDKPAIMMLMRAVVINYPDNNQIATKLSSVLPQTKKIIANRDRAEEDPENAFIICVLDNETTETVKAPINNRIIWNMFREWGEGK